MTTVPYDPPMTAHQLARALLERPDLPVYVFSYGQITTGPVGLIEERLITHNDLGQPLTFPLRVIQIRD